MSQGFGLEDLETCEHVFLASNSVTQLTRHATQFHRRQFIDMFFCQCDAEKYKHLGQFLLNNYKQVLEILCDTPVHIQSLLPGWHISDAQFSTWLQEEHKYLNSKKSKPEKDILATHSQRKQTRATDQARLCQVTHDAWEGVVFLQKELEQVEEKLDIGTQWTPEQPEYQRAADYIHTCKFQVAVDKLEGLVVQWLFELTKANVSQTGMDIETLHPGILLIYKRLQDAHAYIQGTTE
ncbi:hypothetical protein JB92DRAFT_3119260 [Gautieria morchelliformis]|nr:hypothetical protein JB92DRAFT_3119260 [Gautieria morchelliformis]